MKKQCVLLTALVLACGVPASFSTGSSVGFTAMAQSNGKVSGVVKDADGEPLIGVTVRVKGTQRGTLTVTILFKHQRIRLWCFLM